MKSLLLSLVLTFIISIANATSIPINPETPRPLPETAISISPLVNPKILSVSQDSIMCPMVMGTDCKPGVITTVIVNYTLKGCVDEISPVTYTTMKGNDLRHKILLSAHNIHTAKSQHVMCFVAETRNVHVQLEGFVPADRISVEALKPVTAETEVRELSEQHVGIKIAQKAFITDVVIARDDKAAHTVINLAVPYTCGNVLSDINVRARPLINNQMLVYVSAVEATLSNDAPHCKSLPVEQISVSVPGVYGDADVAVANLRKIAPRMK